MAAEKRKREKEEAGPGEKLAKKGRAKPKAKPAAKSTQDDKEWPEDAPEDWPLDDDDPWTEGDEVWADGLD